MKKLVLSLFCAAMVFSCSKEEIVLKENSDESRFQQRLTHSSVSASAQNLENTASIATSGYSVVNGILRFESLETFNSFMTSFVNQDISIITSWEEDQSFTSLRSVNEGVLDNQDVDAVEFNNARVVKDVYFESVLSADAKIQVGDSLFAYNLSNKSVEVTNLETGTVENIPLTMSAQFEFCDTWRKTKVQKIYNTSSGDIMVVNEKWVQGYLLYSSVGTDIKSYKKKKRFGVTRWRKHEVDKLSIYLDQWNFVKAGVNACYDEFSKTNILKTKSNTNGFGKTYIALYGPGVLYCIEYGRLHAWAFNDYNNDVHNEPWY